MCRAAIGLATRVKNTTANYMNSSFLSRYACFRIRKNRLSRRATKQTTLHMIRRAILFSISLLIAVENMQKGISEEGTEHGRQASAESMVKQRQLCFRHPLNYSNNLLRRRTNWNVINLIKAASNMIMCQILANMTDEIARDFCFLRSTPSVPN